MENDDRRPDGDGMHGIDRVRPLSPFAVINIALRDRWSVLAAVLIVTAAVLLIQLMQAPSYTSTASFLPESSRNSGMSRFSGLAAQVGIGLTPEEPGASPEFYAHLIQSREILGRIARNSYSPEPGGGARVPLVQLYGIREPVPEEAVGKAIEQLRRHITARPNAATGMVQLSISTQWPAVSAEIAGQLLDLVNEFNLRQRQSRAATEREFVESRLKEAKSELIQAENQLQRFHEENRQYGGSPLLMFQVDRLEREVALRQSVVTSLAQSHDQARIEQVRNTPVITVVENPDLPVRMDDRNLFRKLLTGGIIGFLLGLGFVVARESYRSATRVDPERYDRFVALRRDAIEELRRPFSRGRR